MTIARYMKLAQPPARALRPIAAGRLKGKTDINPQWRYEAMTAEYGLCGIGWKFEITRTWTEPGPEQQVFTFATIALYVRNEDHWSDPIPGIGGNMLVDKETKGLHANDEGFKMAVTDALSTAMKMIGVGADVYAGLWDGSSYKNREGAAETVTFSQVNNLKKAWFEKHKDELTGLSKDDLAGMFAHWVKGLVKEPFDVTDFRAWTSEELEACTEALA